VTNKNASVAWPIRFSTDLFTGANAWFTRKVFLTELRLLLSNEALGGKIASKYNGDDRSNSFEFNLISWRCRSIKKPAYLSRFLKIFTEIIYYRYWYWM
jgi:hypothetical protein